MHVYEHTTWARRAALAAPGPAATPIDTWTPAMAVAPDSAMLVVAGPGPYLLVWDTLTWQLIHVVHLPLASLRAVAAQFLADCVTVAGRWVR